MAEETKYIPYGQDEISQQDLQTALANDLPNFVSQYKWLQKPKNQEKFLKAYDDIMKGFTGATNEGGRWKINTNTVIDTASMSPKDREIYEHAAYYIQQQMAKMTPKAKAEETKKENLDKFNFQESFGKQLLNLYGGNPEIFRNSEQGWNSLDARGADGFRGTKERRRVMAEQLKLYKQDLEGKDYNFEGTSFKDKQDALNKLQTAIDALGTDEETDDLPAFSALGLNYRNFFSNGGNEELILEDGTKTTYQEYNQAQKKKLADEAKAKAELAKQQRANQWKAFRTFDFSHLNGRPLTSEESNTNYLNQLFAKGKWNGDESSQIVQAFKMAEQNGLLVPLSQEEQNKLGSTWANRKKHLRKIDGIETPLYYDTVSKQFKLFHNNDVKKSSFQEILDKNNPKVKKEQDALAKKMAQDKYLANTEWTPDKTRELLGIAADVASVIDPEPFSAAGLALTGTGLRTWNRAFDEDGFTLSDIGHTLLDTGLSALGAIPIVGDSALSARILGKLQKASGWLGVIFAAGSVPQAAKAAWDKVVNGKDMTVDDWRAIGNVIMGFTQARRMALNNSAGKVIQRGEVVTENSPDRIQNIAGHFNKDSWNIRQRTGQTNIKSPWYKRAWNYFNDPYKPAEAPKTDNSNSKNIVTEGIKAAHNTAKQAGKYMKRLVKKDEFGGTLNNPSLDAIIEDFIKNNNI